MRLRRYDDGFSVLKALERPAVEPQALHLWLLGKRVLRHLEDTGLARTPVTMHPDCQWSLGRIPDQPDHRLGDGFIVQKIGRRLLIVQKHL